ncbi:hypothetical protein FCV25MIE_05429 [Fagus crenata]
MALTEGILPQWRALRAVIRTLLPTQDTQTGTETTFKQNDVEVLNNLTSIISLENSLLFLSFRARDMTLTVIEIHQRVLSFRLSLNLIPNASPHLLSYRVVLNPQLRDSQETLRENRRRENLRRRTS